MFEVNNKNTRETPNDANGVVLVSLLLTFEHILHFF